MRLDRDRRPAERRRGLDHIRVERPLHQEADVACDVLRGFLEHVDERVPDASSLLLGILHALELAQESPARVGHAQVDAEVRPEGLLHLVALVQAQQPVVHEDAGEPVPDGAVRQRRRYARVHAAREPADRPLRRTDGLADLLHRVLDEVRRRPIARAAADVEQKVVEDLATPRRMGDFGVEQHPENRARLVPHRRHRCVGARPDHPEARRRLAEPVPVARPHRDAALGLESAEQALLLGFPDRDLSAPVLALRRRLDLPARQVRDQLHPVADAEDGHAELEQLRVRGGRTGVEHRARAAREDDPLRLESADESEVAARRVDLAVDVRLAYPAGDELRVLRSVIQDQDPAHARYQVVGSSTSPRSRSSSVSRCRAT